MTWHIYIVCNILCLNISSIYINVDCCCDSRHACFHVGVGSDPSGFVLSIGLEFLLPDVLVESAWTLSKNDSSRLSSEVEQSYREFPLDWSTLSTQEPRATRPRCCDAPSTVRTFLVICRTTHGWSWLINTLFYWLDSESFFFCSMTLRSSSCTPSSETQIDVSITKYKILINVDCTYVSFLYIKTNHYYS